MTTLIVVIYLIIAFTFMYLVMRHYKQSSTSYEPTTESDIYRAFGVCILWPLSVVFGIIRLVAEYLVNWINK
jgi:hypothetical protein